MKQFAYLLLILLILSSCTDRKRMETLLLRAEEMNETYVPMDTVKFMHEVLDYYMSYGNHNEKMRANYMVGCIYRDKGDAPMALQYYEDAINEADTTSMECDFYRLCRIYGQMAFLLDEQSIPSEGIKMWKKANRYALLAKDSFAAINYYERIGETYEMLGNDSLALFYNNRAYSQYMNIGRRDYAASSLATNINYELQRNDFSSAKQHIDFFIRYSEIFDENGNIAIGREMFYETLGRYYEGTNQQDSALFFYRKLLNYPKDTKCMESGYRGLLSVYEKIGIPDSMAKYACLYAETNDAAVIARSGSEMARMLAIYNYKQQQRQTLMTEQKANRLWSTICVIMMLVMFLLVVIVVVLRRYKEARKRLMLENRKYSDTLYQSLQLRQELQRFIANSNQYKEEKEREIEKLEHKLSLFQDEEKKEVIDTERMMLELPVVKRMHHLAAHVQRPTAMEWEALVETTRQNLPDFYTKIQTANLTNQEIRVCILIRFAFTSSEMVVLFNLTKQRISNLRRDINMKMFQISGTQGVDTRIHNL